MSEYRIIERAPKEFVIQKKFKRITGCLWWKKEVDVWHRVTKTGQQFMFSVYFTNANDLVYYESLNEAKESIELFKRDTITYVD